MRTIGTVPDSEADSKGESCPFLFLVRKASSLKLGGYNALWRGSVRG